MGAENGILESLYVNVFSSPQIFLVFLLFFFAAVALFRSNHERQLIVFMVRSQVGVALIEWLANKGRNLWIFLADFSILLSFGGLGGFFLSHNEETRKNLPKAMSLFGLIFFLLSLFLEQPFFGASIFAYSIIVNRLGIRDSRYDFFSSSILLAIGSSMVFTLPFSLLIGFFGLPAVMIVVLVTHGFNILSSESDLPGISPMLPSTKEGNVGVSFPGYDIFIPWWHALTAIFITLAVHEGFHGILVRCSKIPLKSTGLLTVISIPIGAFVEPDEEELKKHPSWERMRVFSAGPFANFVAGLTAFIFMISLGALIGGYYYANGMLVQNVMEGYPAYDVIPQDSVIYSIDGVPTDGWDSYHTLSQSLIPGDNVELNTSKGFYSLKLAENPNKEGVGFMGVIITENQVLKDDVSARFIGVINFFIDGLYWIIFFNINIGLVNLLPVLPFDGGRMFKELIEALKISNVNVSRILYIVLASFGLLLLVNMLPLFKLILDYIF